MRSGTRHTRRPGASHQDPSHWRARAPPRRRQTRLRVPEFIRQRVLERRLQIGSPRQLGVDEFRELNRIGVNLNQIARALNQRGDIAAPGLDELRRLGELIAHLLER